MPHFSRIVLALILILPSSTFTSASSAPPTAKKRDHRQDRDAAGARRGRSITAKISGPKMPANFSNDREEAEELARLVRGIRLANSERLSAWLPPCTMPDQDGQEEEVRRGGHEVAEDADPGVDASEAKKIERFAPMRPASIPKRNAKGMPTNWTSSTAPIIALWSIPISSP